jgi:hypothetical protein
MIDSTTMQADDLKALASVTSDTASSPPSFAGPLQSPSAAASAKIRADFDEGASGAASSSSSSSSSSAAAVVEFDARRVPPYISQQRRKAVQTRRPKDLVEDLSFWMGESDKVRRAREQIRCSICIGMIPSRVVIFSVC